MNGGSNSLSISALMSSSSNTTMKKNDREDSSSFGIPNSNKEMEVLESLLQLQMSKDEKPFTSLNSTSKRKSFEANKEQQFILQSIPPITQVEPAPTTPSEPSKTEHIEDSLPRDKRLRQFQNTFFDSTLDNSSTTRYNAFSTTQPNTNGTSPVWPMANLSLPLPPKSRPLANYNNAHSKSLNDLQTMVRLTKSVQRPPTPSSLVPKKCNSFDEIPGVNVKTEKPFSNIQLPIELPSSPEAEPKKAKGAKKPALPFEPTFLVRDKIPPNRRFFDEQWMQHFQELKEFHAKYGHTNVTRTADEYRGLGNWVAEQRRKLRKGRLSKDQFDLLNTIDFEWDRSYYFKATTEPGSMSPNSSPPASPPVTRHAPESSPPQVFTPVQSAYPKPLPPLPFQMTEIKTEPKINKLLSSPEAPSSPMDFSYTFAPFPTTQETRTQETRAPPQKTLCILIAQEDVSNRIILVKLLEGMGYEDIDVAEGGLQMVEMARLKQYDCIVLDLAISGVDAVEFTKYVRNQQNLHQPYIIGVSTKSSSVFLEDRNRCIQAGINEIVSSPLNRDHLSAALQTCFAFKPL